MKKNYEYFEDHTDYEEELDRMKKEMQDLIDLRRKTEEAYLKMLDSLAAIRECC